MARGDQIYVMRPFWGLTGVYEHHGIDCGDGTVIHYSKAEEVATVRRTSMADFSWGNPVHVVRYPTSYIPEVAIERAEIRLGEQRYNLISNNCEHFATWCKTGINHSKQVEEYGLDLKGIGASESGKLVEEAARSGDVNAAGMLFQQAFGNVSTAERQLRSQYDQLQSEMNSWHRVAQVALQRGNERLARAALERKVKAKQQASDLKEKIDELSIVRKNLNQNKAILDQRIQVSSGV